MVQLLSDEELSHIDPKELPQIIEAMRAPLRNNIIEIVGNNYYTMQE